jgi:hypothetical protein
MYEQPVMPWEDFVSTGVKVGMILKLVQPHGGRTLWGEVVAARFIEGEVEFTVSWIMYRNPAERPTARKAEGMTVRIKPLYKGPYYYPRGTKFRIHDERKGLVHELEPPLDARGRRQK